MLYALTSETSNGHDFTISMLSSTRLNKEHPYEVAFINGFVNYGWPNISAALGNNIIKYRPGGGVTAWETLTISDGTYTIEALNALLRDRMITDGNYDAGTDTRIGATSDDQYYIKIEGNFSTGRVKITILNAYEIDLSASLIYKVLGFNINTILTTPGTYEGTNIPDFNRGVNQVQIRCDLVANNAAFVNGRSQPVLYGFSPIGSPYKFINVAPNTPIYLPMNGNILDKINIKITDQDGNPLTVSNEKTTVLIDIRVAKY